jgi:hypothetical protein
MTWSRRRKLRGEINLVFSPHATNWCDSPKRPAWFGGCSVPRWQVFTLAQTPLVRRG